jgi:hypothetical protein
VWLFSYPIARTKNNVVDGTIVFDREVYRPFEEIQREATVRFIASLPAEIAVRLDSPGLYVGTLHNEQTSAKQTWNTRYWTLTTHKAHELFKAGA